MKKKEKNNLVMIVLLLLLIASISIFIFSLMKDRDKTNEIVEQNDFSPLRYIESRIDPLFLADEEISFNVRVHNPTNEILEGRLFVEVIGPKDNFVLFKDRLYIYPGELYLKSLDDKLEKGDYKVRIVIKDRFFETVFDQKILEFKVASSCDAKDICSYERALEKCEKCRPKIDPFDAFIPIFFGVIILGIILLIYFDTKRRNLLD